MAERLPWFRCFPSALLGALAGLDPDEGLVYVTALLRIYETGAPVGDTARTLGRRTGLNERRAGAALERLLEAGKLVLTADGRLDSASTHAEIEWQRERHDEQAAAGRASAAKRQKQVGDKKNDASGKKAGKNDEQKSEQNQQNSATGVQRPLNHLEEEEEQKKDKPSSAGGAPAKLETAASPRGAFLTADWQPSEADWTFALTELGSEHSARRELMKFRNFWFGKSGEAGRKRSWDATWRNWVMKEADHGSGHHNPARPAAPGGGRGGSSFDVVAAGLARAAAQRGIRPGGRQNGGGQDDPRDRPPRPDDPPIEDAHWTPADGHRAAHH